MTAASEARAIGDLLVELDRRLGTIMGEHADELSEDFKRWVNSPDGDLYRVGQDTAKAFHAEAERIEEREHIATQAACLHAAE